MSKLPPLDLLWANYPTDPDPESIKRMIGGRVDLPWISNTCTIRMSYAFNRAGSPIPRKHPSLTTVRGGDGLWYAIRVREFKRYLEREFGAPGVTGTMRSEFAGHQGILVFDVEGWNDATGHLDVWNGTRAKHGEYWEAAKAVYLWICE